MQKLFKGSALVYTLIMMLFLMVGALALMTTTIIQQRGVSGTTESVRAFQVANDGFEDVIAQYNKGASTLANLGSCVSGSVTNSIATGGYTATFTDSSETAITDCNADLSTVAQVKVVSTVGSSTRAIEAAFGAGCSDGDVCVIAEGSTQACSSSDISAVTYALQNGTVEGVYCKYSSTGGNYISPISADAFGTSFNLYGSTSTSSYKITCQNISGSYLVRWTDSSGTNFPCTFGWEVVGIKDAV